MVTPIKNIFMKPRPSQFPRLASSGSNAVVSQGPRGGAAGPEGGGQGQVGARRGLTSLFVIFIIIVLLKITTLRVKLYETSHAEIIVFAFWNFKLK